MPIGQDLETCLLAAISQGSVESDTVNPKDLTTEGRHVLKAFGHLQGHLNQDPPYSLDSVRAALSEVFGVQSPEVSKLLKKVEKTTAGAEAKLILEEVRQKQHIVDLINAASEQLASGEIDLARLAEQIEEHIKRPDDLSPLSGLVTGSEDMPEGPPVKSLPALSKATGGLLRLWVVGGEPGLGKSTLALQLALEYAKHGSVLYVDFENIIQDLDARITAICGGKPEKAKSVTDNIFLRDDVRTIAADMTYVKPPALIVIDSLQNLPSLARDHRQSLDRWLQRMKGWTKKGYSVLAVSEISRAAYEVGDASMRDFKESGGIEYAASVGVRITPVGTRGDIEVHIVKNRNRPKKGHICTLNRDESKGGWWFKEEEEGEEIEL